MPTVTTDPVRYPYTVQGQVDLDQVAAGVKGLALASAAFVGPCGSGQTVEALFASPGLSAQDKASLDAYMAGYAYDGGATLTGLLRAAADALLASDPSPASKLTRAVVLTALGEFNLLRQRLTDQDAAVAAATSLADLKSRWAAVAGNDPMAQRTAAQLRAAVKAQIDGGSAD